MTYVTDLPALSRDVYAACHLTGEFTLRSGQVATEYFDKYRFESDPALLRRVAEAMVPLIPSGTDVLGGLEMGGIPLVTMLSSLSGVPAVFVRKEAKTYGTCQLAEGASVEGQRITLVEDVVTTGGAIRDATRELRARGAVVEDALCAIRRSADAEVLADVGLRLHPLLTRADLEPARAVSETTNLLVGRV
jgi:orotate phosphoribosyltransferase